MSEGEAADSAARPWPVAALAGLAKIWAILAGVLTIALALMTAASAVLNIAADAPIAAEHELTKHVVAVVVFMLLPYGQLTAANVTVDIFTSGMGERAKAVMGIIGSLFALAFALVLLRQMSLGLQSYLDFVEVTPVLGLPLWTAFPPILVSLALLAAAALVSVLDGMRALAGRPRWFVGERV